MNEERVLTPAERKAWRALYEAQTLVRRRIEHDLVVAGVGSLSDYGVLYTLYLSPERRIRFAELADAVMLSRSGLTRLVNRLETLGYLSRLPCEDDRRGTFAVLEDTGVEEMRRIWAIYSSGIAKYFAAHVSPDESEPMTAAFRRVIAANGATSE